MKSIIGNVSLRGAVLEALGWKRLGGGMWEYNRRTVINERVPEDKVIDMEAININNLQSVFERLVEEQGDSTMQFDMPKIDKVGKVEADEQCKCSDKKVMPSYIESQLLAIGEDLLAINERLDSLELASKEWKKLRSRVLELEDIATSVYRILKGIWSDGNSIYSRLGAKDENSKSKK